MTPPMRARIFGAIFFHASFLLCSSPLLVQAAPEDAGSGWYSSWFGSSSNDDADDDDYNTGLKSPLLNRELTTAVKAHAWPTLPSSALCEAYAFFQQEDSILQQRGIELNLMGTFLDVVSVQMAAAEPLPTYYDAAKMTTKLVKGSDVLSPYADLLDWSLQLRANSPLCEVHRGLARQTLQDSGVLTEFGDSDVLVVALPTLDGSPTILKSLEEVAAMDWSGFSEQVGETVDEEAQEEHVLPGELLFSGQNKNASSLVILYGKMDSSKFVQTFNEFKELGFPFAVRSLGAVHYEEIPTSAVPTSLAGFGVRLDIRNVEYKVFDDSKKSSGQDDELDKAMINLTETEDLMPSTFLAGVNLTALVDDGGDGEVANATLELRNKLWSRHEAQQTQAQKIPPLWQRRQLPLQAAAVLAEQGNANAKGDVLLTMKQLVQDLPSVASTLVQVKIPPHVHQWANALWDDPKISRLMSNAQFYVNGRATSVSRPSFNVFELLNVVRMEERRVQNLQTSLMPLLNSLTSKQTALSRIQNAWIQGSDFGADDKEDDEEDEDQMMMGGPPAKKSNVFRIDVGRGWRQAVMYVNDVEKDEQYRQWTRSLQQMFMSMQYGMPPSVRRNLYTMTLVLDPTKTEVQNGGTENSGLDLTMQLMQNQYPVRLGLVIVDQSDVQKCKDWLQEEKREANAPCPLESPILKADDSISETPATARAVHRLTDFFLGEYGSQPGATSAYVEYFISNIAQEAEEKGELTIQELISVHVSLLDMMGLDTQSSGEAKAKAALLKTEEELEGGTNVYGKGLRFAAERGLSPGMSFLNGRPLPDDQDGTHKVFSEEQQHLMGMIMSGQIRDDAPRSIFGKLLTGDGVFGRMHPLLSQGKASSGAYEELKHPFDSSGLIIQQQESEAEVHFVAEIVLDYGTERGLAQLQNLLDSIEKFPTSVTENDKVHAMAVGYRILPSSKESSASPLCPALAKAALVGLGGLKNMAVAMAQSTDSVALDDLVGDLDKETQLEVKSAVTLCESFDPPENKAGRIVGNGRVYEFGNEFLAGEDIELLASMGWKRAQAVYGLLKDLFRAGTPLGQIIEPVGAVSQLLAIEETKPTKRQDVAKLFEGLEKEVGEGKSMRFQWNEPSEGNERLKSLVTAIVDPVDLSTQRLVPLLEILRDHLKLPLQLILAPQTSISGDSNTPIASYYRFVATASDEGPIAHFSSLPLDHVLTLRLDVPEPWDVQQTHAIQDTDNLRCDMNSGCSDDAHTSNSEWTPLAIKTSRQLTEVEYGLQHLLAFGQCYEDKGPPNGLQFVLSRHAQKSATDEVAEVEVGMDGSINTSPTNDVAKPRYSDTLVMKNVGYWQLRANPGVWDLAIEESSKGSSIFDFADAAMSRGRLVEKSKKLSQSKKIVLKDFVNKGEMILVKRRKGYEGASLFYEEGASGSSVESTDDVIHVFSLATGHLYERFLKIMMLSVTKRASSKVKFWLFENFLSPTFKETSRAMARRIGCEVEFVTYKWPEWLRGQTEKQRIIWGYKILFLDVLFPLNVKKIIYVDADQVVRADLKELWDMDLKGAPYGYTPFCSSRATTVGYQFWRDGFWKNHLQGKPYHISALYVVDLKRFRKELVGDQLRSIYQQLSADPNSLANLDQDLPNYAQNQVRIFSLPQDWLWCESWCSDETKATAKTIDLCNNPLHKEPKVSMAKRVIDGPLFNESWVELDAEVERYEQDFLQSGI